MTNSGNSNLNNYHQISKNAARENSKSNDCSKSAKFKTNKTMSVSAEQPNIVLFKDPVRLLSSSSDWELAFDIYGKSTAQSPGATNQLLNPRLSFHLDDAAGVFLNEPVQLLRCSF